MFEYIAALESNKFFIGILMILMNIWGRYVVDEVSTSEEEYRRNIILRRIAIFALAFTATRDLVVSIFLTAGFVILAMGVSRRGQEGMTNQQATSLIHQPAYDPKVPALFPN